MDPAGRGLYRLSLQQEGPEACQEFRISLQRLDLQLATDAMHAHNLPGLDALLSHLRFLLFDS